VRIIAGEFRSRRLLTPQDARTVRPMPDRVRESLFGLLRGHCEGAAVFDAFAGTGSLGLEAVSRGAARCVLVEKDRHAADLLERNIAALGVQDRCELVRGDALGAGALARCPRPLTLAFFDPPYPLVRDPVGWMRVREQVARVAALLTPDGFAVVRTPWPFVHLLDPVSGLPVRAPGSAHRDAGQARGPERRHRGPRRESDRARSPGARPSPHDHDPRHDEPIDEWDDDTLDAPAGVGGVPPGPQPRRVGAELSIPGTLGPETHVYHGTAIHLYMRRPVPAGGDGAPSGPIVAS